MKVWMSKKPTMANLGKDFYQDCSDEARRHADDVYNDCPLTAYYGHFEKCVEREMPRRFEDVDSKT